MEIRAFLPQELDTLAEFAAVLNGSPATGSAFCCARPGQIRADFAENMLTSLATWQDGQPVGLLSCYYDREKSGADCTLLIAPDADYAKTAAALFARMRDMVGRKVKYTFYFPAENAAQAAFLKALGARRQVNEYLLGAEKETFTPPPSPWGVRPLERGEEEAFAALHDEVFPNLYANGQDLLNARGKGRFVFVTDEAGPNAYGVLLVREGDACAVAEIIGVREGFRGQGRGRAILAALAQQAFETFGAGRVELIVDSDNRKALSLYTAAGFELKQENYCYIA